jgi:hypothetical protein
MVVMVVGSGRVAVVVSGCNGSVVAGAGTALRLAKGERAHPSE